MRRFIALALVLTLLSSGVTSCSQPIDTGSTIPAQSQPIVALLALIGLGIGITAWHHHNERTHSGGGQTVFGAQFTVPPLIGGYKAVDLVPDPVNATLGALEVPSAGGGTGKFIEIQQFSGTASQFGVYSLPTNYSPAAVAMDSGGLTWFVDASGHIQGCAPMTTTSTTCTSQGTFSDGLGAGARSIGVDVGFIVVIVDAGSGKVKWWAQQGGTATGTGTYTPASSTSPIFAADAIKLSTTGPSGFTVYHQDGSSDFITFTLTGSTLSVNVAPNFAFNPIPLVGLSEVESTTNDAFYSFTGSPSGSYFLTKFQTTGQIGITKPTSRSELIELNGRVGNPAGAPFTAPLSSIRFDAAEGSVWTLDASGNIVNFAPF